MSLHNSGNDVFFPGAAVCPTRQFTNRFPVPLGINSLAWNNAPDRSFIQKVSSLSIHIDVKPRYGDRRPPMTNTEGMVSETRVDGTNLTSGTEKDSHDAM